MLDADHSVSDPEPTPRRRPLFILLAALSLGLLGPAVPARAQGTDAATFFEQRIRPLLAEHCFSCHGADPKKLRGGLTLTTRAGLLEGGDTGPAVVPGKADASL